VVSRRSPDFCRSIGVIGEFVSAAIIRQSCSSIGVQVVEAVVLCWLSMAVLAR
jgi:hypothetical protein